MNSYIVSRDGTVTDLRGIPLKQYKEKNGYMRVWVRQDGHRKKMSVHRLVAIAFIPNPENKPCVNHIDGNKNNNNVNNLEWCTFSENETHSHVSLGKTIKREHIEALVAGHTEKVRTPVVQKSLDGNEIATYKSMADAQRETKISQGNISMCCNNKRKTAGGYKWSFVH